LTEPNKAIEEPASSAPSHPLSAEQAKQSATEAYIYSYPQREVFRGLLVPLFARTLASHVQQGYEEMNLALKQRCEASLAGVG
jgi:hypothetical protein